MEHLFDDHKVSLIFDAHIIQESLQSSKHKLQTVDMGDDHVAFVLSAPLSEEYTKKLQVSDS